MPESKLMDDKQKQTWDVCETLLTACRLIGVHTVGTQSRLELGMSVDLDLELIERDLESIKSCVEHLRTGV